VALSMAHAPTHGHCTETTVDCTQVMTIGRNSKALAKRAESLSPHCSSPRLATERRTNTFG
jgi:hypothetical protein